MKKKQIVKYGAGVMGLAILSSILVAGKVPPIAGLLLLILYGLGMILYTEDEDATDV